MRPLSIVAAFAFLGMFSTMGALMTVMGSRRMFKLAGSPSLLTGRVTLPVYAFLLTLGLVVLALGIRGIYRLIWVA
ncbi:MAG: hypothetical protein HW388_1268 [Dehalococcoidia bacterium]|nr:hypothetical protein [Dehalococcoidia bacterium]